MATSPYNQNPNFTSPNPRKAHSTQGPPATACPFPSPAVATSSAWHALRTRPSTWTSVLVASRTLEHHKAILQPSGRSPTASFGILHVQPRPEIVRYYSLVHRAPPSPEISHLQQPCQAFLLDHHTAPYCMPHAPVSLQHASLIKVVFLRSYNVQPVPAQTASSLTHTPTWLLFSVPHDSHKGP